MNMDVRMLVGGHWRDGASGETCGLVNPATGREIGRIAMSTTSDLDDALTAAEAGLAIWRDVPGAERQRILDAGIALMMERSEEIAQALSAENGKPLPEARIEVQMAAQMMKWNAEEARRTYGRILAPNVTGMRQMVTVGPVGVVVAFTPWNMPAVTPARKLSAAIAAGCSIILKPSEDTPKTAELMVAALHDAGLPDGVVNLVYGDPPTVSEHLISSGRAAKITFTGSTRVGKLLGELAGRHMVRTSMELGGHAPFMVFEDADVDRAVAQALIGKFRNAGQVCVSPTRFLVHDTVYDRFLEQFVAGVAKIRPGSANDPESTMGPMISERSRDGLQRMISDALAKGAGLAAGGQAISGDGYFQEPTVLTDVPTSATIMNDEPFGPVALINRFQTYNEAVAEANRLPVGLAAYAFAGSQETTMRLARDVKTGMLAINNLMVGVPESPWGGIGDSGMGSEGGTEGISSYLSIKYVAETWPANTPQQWTSYK